MKKLLKILACGGLSLIFICAGCSAREEESERRIRELEARLAQQEQLLAEEETRRQEEGAEFSRSLAELQAETELLRKKFRNLMGAPVKFTASAPHVLPALTVEETFDRARDESLDFAHFLAIFREKYKEAPICLLSPIEQEDDFHPLTDRIYKVCRDKAGRICVTERLQMLSEDLYESPGWYQGEGGMPWSLRLEITLFPEVSLDRNFLEGLRWEFGNNGEGGFNEYVNLYCYNACFGVCYYQTNAYISERWFGEYFHEHLVLA